MSLTITLVALLTCAGLAADDATSSVAPSEYAGYRLVWAEEFDKLGQPDDDAWGYESGFVRNQEAQWYQPDNARVEGGLLVIEGRRERVPNPRYDEGSNDWRRNREFAEYTSSSLTTSGKREWLYGRFEMRAKIDMRAGLWPAWWTLGANISTRTWPACGEIDIMEYFDGDLLANACWAAAGGQNWDAVRKPLRDLHDDAWSSRFHVWRMDWSEESILIYVDDRLLNTVALSATLNPDGTNPFREPHYMIVNLAIGGTRGGDPSATEFPARYEIDYIRVYQRADKPAATDVETSPKESQEKKMGTSLRGVDAWINEVMLANSCSERGVDRYYGLEGISYQGMPWYQEYPAGALHTGGGLSEQEIELFIAIGPPAIPRLMKHVRDCTATPWQFYYPLCSGIDLDADPLPVGKMSCYLIEAILRKNAFFTRTAQLLYASPSGEEEPECVQLLQAAAAYESWVDRCYDSERSEIKCPADDFPDVRWDYDLQAWPPGYRTTLGNSKDEGE